MKKILIMASLTFFMWDIALSADVSGLTEIKFKTWANSHGEKGEGIAPFPRLSG